MALKNTQKSSSKNMEDPCFFPSKSKKYNNTNNIQMFLKNLRDTQKNLGKSPINHQEAPLNISPILSERLPENSLKALETLPLSKYPNSQVLPRNC